MRLIHLLVRNKCKYCIHVNRFAAFLNCQANSCTDVHTASIAQWQSTGLVNQGSRVQSSLEALF